MRRKSTFTIYTRETKDGSPVFYASSYDRAVSRVQRSTGIEDNGTKSARVRAQNIVIEWLGQEKVDTITGEPAVVLLRDFAAGFEADSTRQYLVQPTIFELDAGTAGLGAAE